MIIQRKKIVGIVFFSFQIYAALFWISYKLYFLPRTRIVPFLRLEQIWPNLLSLCGVTKINLEIFEFKRSVVDMDDIGK